MYSDCLDLNRWYHGKSGYIAIIRLTKVLKKEMDVSRRIVPAVLNTKMLLFSVINRVKLKGFQKTIPRISQHPLWGWTAMCPNSSLQYLHKPAPSLHLREPR